MKKGKGKKGALLSSDAGGDQYRMLFESAGDPIFIHDQDRILAVNNKACELLGYSREELLSLNPSDVDTPEERVNMAGRMARLKSRGILNFETVHRMKDGTPVHVDATARVITWDGKPAVMSICKDATRRKHAENILLTTALEWQNTFDSLRDAIFLLDNDFRIMRCNRASSEMFGKNSKDILGRYCWEVVHGTNEPIPECPITRMKKTKKREITVLKAGDRWLEVTADPIFDDEGKICGAVHIISDITELKKMNKELDSSYERFKLILEGASEGILIADVATKKIKYSNPSICRMLGYSAEELSQMTIERLHPASEWQRVLSEFELQSRGENLQVVDIPCMRKDGRIIYADINAINFVFDGIKCNVGFFRDVTDRKKAYQSLNESRMLYEDILDNQAAGIYRIHVRKHEDWSDIDKPPYFYEFLNDRYCEITGASREQHIADPSLTMKLVHPDDLQSWIDDNTASDRALSPFLWEGRLVVKGNVKWVHFESRPRELANTDRVWTGILLDISERRMAEEGMKQSLSLLNATVESTADGILVVDNKGKINYSNNKFSKMWDIPDEVMASGDDEKAIAHVLSQLKYPDLFMNKVKYLYAHPEEESFDIIEFNDGRIFERYSHPQKIAGQPVGRVWSFRDVSMARMAAEFLNSSERKYRSLVETTNTGYVVIDSEGRVLDANQEYVRLAGRNELKEILGRKVTEWTADYEKDKNEEAVRKCAIDGHIRNFEIDYADPSGKITPIEINATVVDSEEGPRILTLCRDITERRKMLDELQSHKDHLKDIIEERTSALRESERKYRELVENANSIILRMDRTGVVTFFNEFAQKFFGFSGEEIIGRNVVGTIVSDEMEHVIRNIGKDPGKFRNNVNENMCKDGERVWIAWTNRPVFDGNGQISEIMCVGNDITERVKAEKELEKYRGRLEELVEERTEELRSKEESLSNAQRIAHLGNWSRDMGTGKVFWSDETRRIFGFSAGEEATFEKFMACLHPEDVDMFRKDFERVVSAHETMQIVEYRICPGNGGGVRHIHARGEFTYGGKGELIRVEGVVLDITDQRKAEQALGESEARFQKIIEQSPMSMAIVAMDGTIEYINRKAVETFGYAHEEIPTMERWWIQAYPDEKYRKEVISTYMGLVKEAIEGNHEIEGREYRATCKNGDVKNVFIFGVPVSNKIFVMFDDITERKRTEQALRDSEERFRTIFEKGPIGMATVNHDGRFLRVNSAFSRMLGYSEEELTKLSYKDVTHPDHIEADMKKVGELIKGEIQIYNTEKRYICKNKGILWGDLTLSTVRDEKGEFLYFLAMLEDVTERKKAEQDLMDSEEKFRILFENSKDALMTLSPPSWKFTSANPAIADMFGVSGIDEFIRHAPWELSPERQPDGRLSVEKAKEMIDIAVRDGYNYFEWKHRRLTGEEFFATVLLTRMNIKGETILQATVRDISSQKKAEEEREKLEERLRQSEKMEAIGQLAGGIAHDFNNQLMGIMGYAEILADRLDDEEMRKDAESILRSSRRAADLTKDLLAFARKGKYQAIPVNIHKVIEEVISLLSHSIDKRIEIRRELKASPALIMGDPTQIQNALLNLAINARDAMPAGGELSFTTETLRTEDTYLKDIFKKTISRRCLKICVVDNGVGMDGETIRHIFEPFFTTKEAGKGTGMGLASVYGTVNSHNGVIDVRSEKGKGTVFSMYFPVLEESIDQEDSKTAAVSPVRKLNILLVDDEEIVRDMVAKMLRVFGHKVFICKDGQEALEYYRQSWQKIDLVVLDMMMPRMNGRDSYIGMRALNPKINAILMSGYSIDGEVQSLLDAGMKGFIQKPFNTRELNKVIQGAVNHGQ